MFQSYIIEKIQFKNVISCLHLAVAKILDTSIFYCKFYNPMKITQFHFVALPFNNKIYFPRMSEWRQIRRQECHLFWK